MKNPSPQVVSKLAENSRRALRAAQGNSRAAENLRIRLRTTAWLSVITGLSVALLIKSVHGIADSVNDHHTWQDVEDRLDEELDSTMDASDPIARY
jgi:septin family protein